MRDLLLSLTNKKKRKQRRLTILEKARKMMLRVWTTSLNKSSLRESPRGARVLEETRRKRNQRETTLHLIEACQLESQKAKVIRT
jgi:hypothetical protein